MITLGLSAINVGDVASDGGMGTVLSPLGKTYRDSCKITQEDGEEIELNSEESDDPEYVIQRAGKIKVDFSVMNPEIATLQKMLGGTVTGVGAAAVWEAPESMPEVEQSIEITPKIGLKITIPRLKMNCKIDWSNVGTTPLLISVSGTVLVPEKAGEPKIQVTVTGKVNSEPV